MFSVPSSTIFLNTSAFVSTFFTATEHKAYAFKEPPTITTKFLPKDDS